MWPTGCLRPRQRDRPGPTGVGARRLVKGTILSFAGEKRGQGPLCTCPDLTPTPSVRMGTVPQAL